MNINELKALCDRLATERAELGKLKMKLSACNLSGHQHDISINVSGIGSVQLTAITRETGYAASLIRGREMIMLGVKKILLEAVEQQSAIVAATKQKIADARIDA